MGWGLKPEIRADVLATGTTYHPVLPVADVYLIDAPAMCRSGAVGSRPATSIVRGLLDQVPATATDVVILFDCPAQVPTARDAVHTRRGVDRSDRRVIDARLLAAATPQSLGNDHDAAPITWPDLFGTTLGKARAYELLHQAFREQTLRSAPAKRMTTISSPADASVWSHPFNQTSPFAADIQNHAYGEAEAQLAMCARGMGARRPDATALIWTIDTDILLQVALTPAIKSTAIQIALAKVYHSVSTVVRTAAEGKKRAKAEALTPMWEVVSCRALAPKATPAGLFWFLCAGGVDYCKGLGGYGWPQRVAVANTEKHPVVTAVHGAWRFDVERLAAILRDTRKSRRKETSVGSFANELDDVLFCWRYYMWQCDSRPNIAGPEKTVYIRSFEAHSITDWLEAATGTVILPNQTA